MQAKLADDGAEDEYVSCTEATRTTGAAHHRGQWTAHGYAATHRHSSMVTVSGERSVAGAAYPHVSTRGDGGGATAPDLIGPENALHSAGTDCCSAERGNETLSNRSVLGLPRVVARGGVAPAVHAPATVYCIRSARPGGAPTILHPRLRSARTRADVRRESDPGWALSSREGNM